MLFCQDFNEQFEGYTQHRQGQWLDPHSCFVRISMNNLKDIHNALSMLRAMDSVVLSGFQ